MEDNGPRRSRRRALRERREEWAEEIDVTISGVFTGSTNGLLTWRAARNQDPTSLSGDTARF
jgi:hypothetical protein